MTRTHLIVAAAGGSAALLLAALGFQYLGGLPPCPLCVWQRWPHLAAVALGPAALLFGGRLLPLAGAAAALTTAGIAAYHTGIERGWWQGPESCSGDGAGLAGLSGDELMSTDAPVQVVMCDEVVWSFAGLSMASWNGLASLALAAVWVMAARRRG